MNCIEYWKNFSLGTELETSGIFIYNGLKQINELNDIQYPEDVFEVLYNLSIGLERLMKIVIVLLEHKDFSNQEDFEKRLQTHNLNCLRNRIENNHNLGLELVHKEFLALLTTFYNKYRYNRFNLNKSDSYSKDKVAFIQFLCEKLELTHSNNGLFTLTRNTKQIRAFLAGIVKKISITLYEIIKTKARELNMYTYELRSNGKAYRIFMQQDFSFEYHTVLKKELLIALIHQKDSAFINFIKTIKPIPFDVQDENEIIGLMLDDQKLEQFFDALDQFYDELENKKARVEILESLG